MATHVDVVLVDWKAGLERRVASLSLRAGSVVVTGAATIEVSELLSKTVAGLGSLEVASARVEADTSFRTTGRHVLRDCAFAAGDDRPMARVGSVSDLVRLRGGAETGEANPEPRHLRVAQ